MKITLFEPVKGINTTLEVSPNISLNSISNIIQIDFGISADKQCFNFKGQLWEMATRGNYTFHELNIRDGDILILTEGSNSKDDQLSSNSLRNFQLLTNNHVAPNTSPLNKSTMINSLVEDKMKRMKNSYYNDNTSLSNYDSKVILALQTGDDTFLRAYLRENIEKNYNDIASNQHKLLNVISNPLDTRSQQYLLDNIYQERINETFLRAQEYIPESLAPVCLLYIKLHINNIVMKALVDTGAQTSIISQECADRCGLRNIIDKRFDGIVRGVGKSRIIGRIHLIQLKIGNTFFATSLVVIEDNNVDFLFGLDLIKRYQCVIDLKKNSFLIDNEEISFLSEYDIKQTKQLNSNPNSSASSNLKSNLNSSTYAPQCIQNTNLVDTSDINLKMSRLEELGFLREDIIKALENTNGNLEEAALLLSYKFL